MQHRINSQLSLATIVEDAVGGPLSGLQKITKLADNKYPITIPWSPGMPTHLPGTMFHSRLCKSENPWSKTLPWDPNSIQSAKLAYLPNDGGFFTFHSIETTNNQSSEEHLTASSGITAGCSFLGTSLTSAYDRDMENNRDGRPALSVFSGSAKCQQNGCWI